MADAQGTAGNLLKTISPMFGAVPIAGPIISGLGTAVGGFLEMDSAKKQQEQAAKEREAALKMKPDAIDPMFNQKLRADKFAALGGMPGKPLWQQMLDQRTANDLRAIQESSPSGAAALTAISAAEGNKNSALNELLIADGSFRAGADKDVRSTMWDIGLQKNREEDIRNEKQSAQLQNAGALEAAGTYNKQNAINKVIGAGTSTVSALDANAQQTKNNDQWMKFLENYYMQTGQLPNSANPVAPTGATGTPITLPMNNNSSNVWNYSPNFQPSYITPF